MSHIINSRGTFKQFSILLFILLVLYFALVRPLAQQGVSVLKNQIEDAVAQLKKYMPKTEEDLLPTKEIVRVLQNQNTRGEENYNIIKNFMDPQGSYLPAETPEAGLYFIEQLHIITKKLKRQAAALKIKVPENFGFSEDMPENRDDVETLLRELDVVDRVVTMLLEQGAGEILLVKPLPVVLQKDTETKELFYRELPVQVAFGCDSSSLIRFLYQIRNFSPVLIIKDMVIKKSEGDSLQVQIVLNRVMI